MVEGLFSVRNLHNICFVKPRFYSLYPACVVRPHRLPGFRCWALPFFMKESHRMHCYENIGGLYSDFSLTCCGFPAPLSGVALLMYGSKKCIGNHTARYLAMLWQRLPFDYPKWPPTYRCVSSLVGRLKIVAQVSNSINSPKYMNAAFSEMRCACCMLCVTITIVKSFFSFSTSSSIFFVLIGSSAEQGSSIRITFGRSTTARAMQRRCCCPPDSFTAGLFNSSFISSHKKLSFRAFSINQGISFFG